MEANSWRPAQGDPAAGAAMEASSVDWRTQLQPEARQRVVNKIMETLKKHLPVSVPEGLNEVQRIAVRFEEKIYTAAVSQSDYLRKISLKMLSMESKTQQNAPINPSMSNGAVSNQNPSDTGCPSDPMEANSWRPTQGDPAAGAAMEALSVDWRTQLQPEARQRVVNKIMETLKEHLPVSVPEGLNELQRIAVQFEEKIYTAAVSQSDYLRKISLKMLSMESKTQQNAPIDPSMSNGAVWNQNHADTDLVILFQNWKHLS